ncbi:MAG: threonine synthase [Clostridia bacterium]|nr:threonine synthase [Clostridia bacterium]
MLYTSTRDSSLKYSAAKCFVQGLSSEGGLFVPESFPQISLDEIAAMSEMSYSERAFKVLSRYLTDFSEGELKDCIESAYGTKFDEMGVAPLHYIDDNTAVMELYHGPTLAFKDVALQILPHFLKYAKKKENEDATILILVATSGDTGKAALEGFQDVEGMGISVFFPNQGVSKMQQLQMTTQEGNNVFVCAVNGNFDDAQTGVKMIFGDSAVKEDLLKRNIKLSSANSINWGRLVPQVVYYFSAYADMLKNSKIQAGDKVNFVVPTGNFGDILAGYYAMRMGLPVNKLICASNKNKVLTEFFETGVYNANREFYKTQSPSMDILISSNLERLLFELSGRDDKFVGGLMQKLKTTGEYKITDEMHKELTSVFAAGYADEDKTACAIKETWQKKSYCVDTHTAVGVAVYDEYKGLTGDNTPTVLLSTASPYKFPHSVLEAIFNEAPDDEFMAADKLKAMGVKQPEQISALKTKAILHTSVCDKEDMKNTILNAVK